MWITLARNSTPFVIPRRARPVRRESLRCYPRRTEDDMNQLPVLVVSGHAPVCVRAAAVARSSPARAP